MRSRSVPSSPHQRLTREITKSAGESFKVGVSHGSVATTSLLLEPSTQIFIPREPDRSRLGIKAPNVFRFEISNQHSSHDAPQILRTA